ncbi:MAG: R3H domain-containing nucleic acid-binding protein [bacterium]
MSDEDRNKESQGPPEEPDDPEAEEASRPDVDEQAALPDLDEIAERAAGMARDILDFFPSVPSPTIEGKVEKDSVWVEIKGDPTGRLIGRRGQTIEAFEHILSKIISHQLRKRMTVHVDAEGYRKRQRDKLEKLAHQTADYVAETGSARALEAMSSADRRLVHLALRDRDDVITASEGRGDKRFVVIWPNMEE